MDYIASGAQADIYKDGLKAIKIFKENIRKEDIEYESNLQKMALNYGFSVPKVYDIIEINGRFGMEIKYIDGIPLGKIILEDNSKISEYLEKSIEVQNEIHKIETDKFPSMKNKLKNHILHTKKLSEMEREIIIKKLEKTVFDNKLCHGDFHVFNLIQTQECIKIIDWICASSGHPYADIYRTYLLYKLFKEKIANIYLEIYCQKYKLEKLEILEWELIVTGARLGEYVKDENEEKILMDIVKNNLKGNSSELTKDRK